MNQSEKRAKYFEMYQTMTLAEIAKEVGVTRQSINYEILRYIYKHPELKQKHSEIVHRNKVVRQKRRIKRVCKRCGKEFEALPSTVKNGGGIICSNCYLLSKKESGQCSRCGRQAMIGGKGLCDRCRARKKLVMERYGVLLKIADSELKKGCQICGVKNKMIPHGNHFKSFLHIDHNHKTGKYRGVLCPNCNHLLGCVQDNPKILTKAIEYLKKRT